MNQQSAITDSLFRAVEDQSLPDLSSIDFHWQEMKNLLIAHPSTGIQKTVVNPAGLILSLAIILLSCLFIIITSKPSAIPINEGPIKTIQPSLKDTIPPPTSITNTKQPAQFKTLRTISLDTAPARNATQFNTSRVIRMDTVLTSSVSGILMDTVFTSGSSFYLTTPIIVSRDSIIHLQARFSTKSPVVRMTNNTLSADTAVPVKRNRISTRKVNNPKIMMSDSIIHN